MKKIALFFTAQVLRRKFGVYIFKVPPVDNEWNYRWSKYTEVENPENSIFNIKKYQLIKSMYKIITSLFLQKSLEAYRNSGIQPNYGNGSCIQTISFRVNMH